MLNSKLVAPLLSDPDVAPLLMDEQCIRFMLRVEVALAKVQADFGIIPAEAADAIARAAGLQVDMQRLQIGIDRSGVPVIDLVQQLREAVGGEAASYVHWGATSQDIMDTAQVLQIRAVLELIERQMQEIVRRLARLADQHRGTLMAGRTYAQQALPITFGMKVANWLAPLLRHRDRLAELKPRLLAVQLGGAVGTLASMGSEGLRVQQALADELGLGVPLMPWHTQRDTLVEFAGWLSLVSGSVAKMAQDIILMAQSEVAEVRESVDPARGGSSTMPQKGNPVQSGMIIAAARSNAALLSALHQALIQEHERATGGSQIEWLTLPQMMLLTAGALKKAVFLSTYLVVDSPRMQANVAASNGVMLAEALDLALAPHIGRSVAKRLIKAACETAIKENRHLVDVVRERIDAPIAWDALRDEAAYLGVTDSVIDRVLRKAERNTS
jgi:3-carboxy-cis,cis-muconate cycloisomerase